MRYSEGSTRKSRGKRATNKVPLSARARLSLAFAVLAGTLNCFFSFSAIAQDTPSEGPKLADDIHETINKVPVTVTLLSGKTYTGPIIVTHYRPDGPGPFPIVIFNHGRPAMRRLVSPQGSVLAKFACRNCPGREQARYPHNRAALAQILRSRA